MPDPDLTAELDAAEAVAMGGATAETDDTDDTAWQCPTSSEGHSTLSRLRWLVQAGYDVVLGSRKGPDGEGYYAALEHLDLDEPEEFYGCTLPVALGRAYAWATAKAEHAARAAARKDEGS